MLIIILMVVIMWQEAHPRQPSTEPKWASLGDPGDRPSPAVNGPVEGGSSGSCPSYPYLPTQLGGCRFHLGWECFSYFPL